MRVWNGLLMLTSHVFPAVAFGHSPLWVQHGAVGTVSWQEPWGVPAQLGICIILVYCPFGVSPEISPKTSWHNYLLQEKKYWGKQSAWRGILIVFSFLYLFLRGRKSLKKKKKKKKKPLLNLEQLCFRTPTSCTPSLINDGIKLRLASAGWNAGLRYQRISLGTSWITSAVLCLLLPGG